ncbi:hypothetical protein HELRODRAFT_166179 [Helobdella robusta]|uniref:non-specific protein-tyrosine kinase n=1 Tax=Helobdella robusta TaxID=6412 RepID=T1EXV6_HELRO|nr:hypothetical protein HELRODRAFT_166179 [Helobdella robusta]ESN90507.1 hypothetical protein HELRODRAFT_166179 [Helobdella robusta]
MTANNPSNKDLLEFLTAAELQHYHNKFVTTLKVNSVTQLKYVDDDDLLSIDMSRPEIKRLRQHFKKESHMGALTKIKKILSKSGQEQSSQSQTTISISPPINLCSASPMKHIIAEESVMLLNVIGRGEFGCVQQGVWTKDSGEKFYAMLKSY